MLAQLNELSLSYEDIGAGRLVLCLPAFPFDHRMYRNQCALANSARLIMPDYRGTGESSRTAGPYTMYLLAEDMVRLLDHLAIDKVVVLGVSMGNYVGFSLVANHPDRVCGMVIADTRAEADTPEQAERRSKTVEGLRAEGTSVLTSRVGDLFAATTRCERPELVEEMLAQVAGMDAEGLAQITLGMALRADRTALLPHIAVPAVVICGAEDTVSPPEGMRRMAKMLPNAGYHEIPAAGHLAPLEQPDLFNALVRAYLATLS
jgi:pimeloyl-ACP methyl ester carboxylesterase